MIGKEEGAKLSSSLLLKTKSKEKAAEGEDEHDVRTTDYAVESGPGRPQSTPAPESKGSTSKFPRIAPRRLMKRGMRASQYFNKTSNGDGVREISHNSRLATKESFSRASSRLNPSMAHQQNERVSKDDAVRFQEEGFALGQATVLAQLQAVLASLVDTTAAGAPGSALAQDKTARTAGGGGGGQQSDMLISPWMQTVAHELNTGVGRGVRRASRGDESENVADRLHKRAGEGNTLYGDDYGLSAGGAPPSTSLMARHGRHPGLGGRRATGQQESDGRGPGGPGAGPGVRRMGSTRPQAIEDGNKPSQQPAQEHQLQEVHSRQSGGNSQMDGPKGPMAQAKPSNSGPEQGSIHSDGGQLAPRTPRNSQTATRAEKGQEESDGHGSKSDERASAAGQDNAVHSGNESGNQHASSDAEGATTASLSDGEGSYRERSKFSDADNNDGKSGSAGGSISRTQEDDTTVQFNRWSKFRWRHKEMLAEFLATMFILTIGCR